MQKLLATIKAVKSNSKKSWLYRLFFMPKYYLGRLFYSTLAMGIFTLLLTYLYINSSWYSTVTVPTTMHSLIGVVIGLMLVFRVNTAYDRWWRGRKGIEELQSALKFFTMKLDILIKDEKLKLDFSEDIKYLLSSFLTFLRSKSKRLFNRRRSEYLKSMLKKLHALEMNGTLNPRQSTAMENAIYDITKALSACETIKNTPIPMSLIMHTKTSILIFLLSLPFGLFHDLGYFSTPVIMLIFFLMAGIEIIANEIEDPFYGDPNDLPTEDLLNEIYDGVLYNLKQTQAHKN
jgi:ion channel-forming bestrophin family protein